jgi:AbrB family looped-hinge helix DNA binding protein
MNTQLVTVSSKFQVVIPQAVRELHGIKPGAKMAWIDFGQGLRLLEVKKPQSYRGIAKGLKNTEIANDAEL